MGTGALRTILAARDPRNTRATGPDSLDPMISTSPVRHSTSSKASSPSHARRRIRLRPPAGAAHLPPPGPPGRRSECAVHSASTAPPSARNRAVSGGGRWTANDASRKSTPNLPPRSRRRPAVHRPVCRRCRRASPAPPCRLWPGSPGGQGDRNRGTVQQPLGDAAQADVPELARRGRSHRDHADLILFGRLHQAAGSRPGLNRGELGVVRPLLGRHGPGPARSADSSM